MPWTSNGVDTNGNLNDFKSGLLAFQQAHPGLVDPLLAVGINKELKQNLSRQLLSKVNPNPAEDGQIKILLNGYEDVMLQITDSRGLILHRQKADNIEMTIQTSSFSKGIYILSVMKKERTESTKIAIF